MNILIGSALCSLIKEAGATLTKVSPLIAEAETRFPFATYARLGVVAPDTKDRVIGVHRMQFDVTVWHDDYEGGLLLASDVITILEHHRDAQIQDIEINDASETYNDTIGAYGQTITLTVTY